MRTLLECSSVAEVIILCHFCLLAPSSLTCMTVACVWCKPSLPLIAGLAGSPDRRIAESWFIHHTPRLIPLAVLAVSIGDPRLPHSCLRMVSYLSPVSALLVTTLSHHPTHA
ncbi:hypothetical protein CC85DRAFT_49675 [Cutaneotrichosporon oleaginosum]|uniref:Secreted protein n=1 Tax=Cutaneotrichosporon oleaginosum TaxID=879819 RepID=A0A0J1B732_9TREE|nr:uncharacterized protein CC85DRAFT_49675 [Cutaneotrichosporon oleaginosum]KLT43534.1 hypothetical protein CC85DRAFT_49675 [Cutaneotrichosporon oleaginosum]TXT05567.1 hypothetical protein COLE_06887 [Cutaneotrichosporon oleaginosum]